MDVQFLILSRYAEMGKDDTLSMIGGGLAIFKPPSVPFMVSTLFVASRVAFDREELGAAHNLQLALFGPNGDQILASEVLRIDLREDFPPDREVFMANVLFGLQNLTLQLDGRYRFALLCDGAIMRETPFRVEASAAVASQADVGESPS